MFLVIRGGWLRGAQQCRNRTTSYSPPTQFAPWIFRKCHKGQEPEARTSCGKRCFQTGNTQKKVIKLLIDATTEANTLLALVNACVKM